MDEREKIIKIIEKWAEKTITTRVWGAGVHDAYNAAELADALIAAGIGDVGETKEKLKKINERILLGDIIACDLSAKCAEYKYRAEVAEKAGRIIQRDMARVFDVSNPRICELIANIWDLAKKQAEKELAEEEKK